MDQYRVRYCSKKEDKYKGDTMKKLIGVTLIGISILLTSCATQDNTQVDNSTTGIVCEESPYFMKSMGIIISEEGYYSQKNSSGVDEDTKQINSEGDYLTYISKETGKETYLCSKLECTHTDEKGYTLSSCNANIKSSMPGSIGYHNEWLYVLTYNESTYEVTLTRVSKDGSVHEDIMVIGEAPDRAGYYKYVFVNDDIYMVENIEEADGIHIDKININKKEKERVYSLDKEGSIGNLKAVGDNIFAIQCEKQGEDYKKSIIKYNCTTKEVESIVEEDLIISYTIVDENTIYYYVETEGLYQLNINSKESKLIRPCDEETKSVYLAYDGTYLYMENIMNKYRYNENSHHQIIVCDLDGKKINTIDMEANENLLPASFCDENYLFATHFSHKGQQWTYIKHEDITKKDVSWTNIE